MTTKVKNYSIDDILKIKMIDKSNFFSFFNNINTYYENFESNNSIENNDITVEFGKFVPKKANSYVIDNKYYFNKDYFYIKNEKYKEASWSFEIENMDEETTTIRVNSNLLGRLFIQGNVIDFIIAKKLSEKGYSLVHASGMMFENRGLLFTGRGGSGKTTICSHLISKGAKFLGDNYIILKDGVLFPFPTALNLFTYNLSDIVLDKLTFAEKVTISIKKFIYDITNGYAKFFTKINPYRIFPKIEASVPLNEVILLDPKKIDDEIQTNNIEYDIGINKIVFNSVLEFPFFNKYIMDYSYVFPEEKLSVFWSEYKKTLMRNIPKTIPFVEYTYESAKNLVDKIDFHDKFL